MASSLVQPHSNVDVATGAESKILLRVGRFTIAFRHALPIGNRYTAPVSPISYGINANVYPGGIAISADRISKPTAFILFAPAQAAGAGATVSFHGAATSPAPGVTVLGIGGNKATSTPGGDATAGTQNNRNRINALFADLHAETMVWPGDVTNVTHNAAIGRRSWKRYTPLRTALEIRSAVHQLPGAYRLGFA